MRTPETFVNDVENKLDYPLGPNVKNMLEELIEELDKRYETNDITIEGTN